MNDLQFVPMDDRAISDYRMLSDIIDELRIVTGVTIIGIRQYASSTDGKIANRQILIGASYENAQAKDLAMLLKLSPSCHKIDGKEWFNQTKGKDLQKMRELASRAYTLEMPDFSNFYTSAHTDNALFYEAWLNVIMSIAEPNVNRSMGQANAYQKICTGIYQHTENHNMYYVRGFEINSQIISPAINPRNPSTNPIIIAQNAIKFGLGLMMTKYRTLHLREDDTRLRIKGKEISIIMTANKIREVTATNEIKALKKENKLLKKKVKELEKKA